MQKIKPSYLVNQAGMSYRAQGFYPRRNKSRTVENVLVMQGGGSLGAFGCGVFKALSKRGIDFDIVSGTSIGALNAAVIAGGRGDEPARDLEDFWVEIAESTPRIFPDLLVPEYDAETQSVKMSRRSSAHLNAVFFGVPKMFVPRWTWFFGGVPFEDPTRS